MISNAISAVEQPFTGVLAENGDVIYSRSPRDLRESDDKTVFIDGERDRCRGPLEHWGGETKGHQRQGCCCFERK